MNPDEQLASIREMISEGIIVDDNVSFLLEHIDYLIQVHDTVQEQVRDMQVGSDYDNGYYYGSMERGREIVALKTKIRKLEDQLIAASLQQKPTGYEQVIRIQDRESLLPKDRDLPDRRPEHEC